MDCWDVLGVERFSDKKTIKIAYAKLLKLHRPDEDPEGFQQLHRAYKSALSWVPDAIDDRSAWMSLESEPSDEALTAVMVESLKRPLDEIAINNVEKNITEVTVEQPILTELALKPPLNDADRQLLDDIQSQEHLLSEDWQKLYLNVSDIIKSDSACNDLQEWRFLESLVSMGDLEFRKAASDHVFEVVAEANMVSLDNKHLYVKRPVLNYLNKQFSWDKKWQEYQLSHSRRMLNAVYPYLEEADRPVKGISKKRELYYYRRGAAFAIDLSIICIPFVVFAILSTVLAAVDAGDWLQQLGFNGASAFIMWVIFYLLVLIPAQEASKYKATIGKRLLQLQVINKRGDRIGFFQAFWRSFVTVCCCVGIKVVVFINFALSYWRSEILQDTLSRSYVILRPGGGA